MKSVLPFVLIGLCIVAATLLVCWACWELQYWWQLRKSRKYPSSSSPGNHETD
ncbi:MAG: hypothetical protein WDM96_14990 [Lacunisphaera sp.]